MYYKERIEKERAYRQALIAEFPNIDFSERSGIYIFARNDSETGLRFAYVGQAKNMIQRLVEHCLCHDHSHIDLSLKKRKFYSDATPDGWKVAFVEYCDEDQMNDRERYWIAKVGNGGYQLLNKTSGGQDGGKIGIAQNAPARGYRDGLKQGYENARRDVAKLFEKNLRAEKAAETKLADRAMEKWIEFLKEKV